jgi:hypothetical protein
MWAATPDDGHAFTFAIPCSQDDQWGSSLVARTIVGENTNTKVLETIAQRVPNDIVASIGPQQRNLRILAEPHCWCSTRTGKNHA